MSTTAKISPSVLSFSQIKKIIFIGPYPYYARGINQATLYPPLGVAYLSAVLEKQNIECKIIDAAVFKKSDQEIVREIQVFNPDIIGITSNIITAKAVLELGQKLRKKFPHKLIIYGGPYATAYPETILKKTGGNVVVRGEGETTIVDLIHNLNNLQAVKGISYRIGQKVFHNPSRELIEDLDTIPFPAFHLLPDFKYYRSRSRKTPIGFLMSSRGCPYHCIYCNSNIYGKIFRPRSPANVLTEIELLVGRYGVKQIEVLDDNFTLDMVRAEKIFDEVLKRKIKVLFNFQNGIRADRINLRLVKKMKKAGVYKATIGVETGDPRIQKIIKKSLDLKKVLYASKILRKEGILVFCSFMIGLPGETRESLQKTIDFAIKVNPQVANFMVVVPLPQTELYKMIETEGRFTKQIDFGSDTGFYTDNFYYEIGDVNQKLVHEYTAKAYQQFYFRPSKILDSLLAIRSYKEFIWTMGSTTPLLQVMWRKFKNAVSPKINLKVLT